MFRSGTLSQESKGTRKLVDGHKQECRGTRHLWESRKAKWKLGGCCGHMQRVDPIGRWHRGMGKEGWTISFRVQRMCQDLSFSEEV